MGCGDKCTEFMQLLVVEKAFHPKSIFFPFSGLAVCLLESQGQKSAPNSNYTEICALSTSEIGI